MPSRRNNRVKKGLCGVLSSLFLYLTKTFALSSHAVSLLPGSEERYSNKVDEDVCNNMEKRVFEEKNDILKMNRHKATQRLYIFYFVTKISYSADNTSYMQ